MSVSLPVVNLAEAKFECIFGRGCDGICCQNGRPMLYADETKHIKANLKKFLPEMRPEAAELVKKEGFVSRRLRGGMPMLRVVGGWCVFFNKGCVLHKVGAEEGDSYRYKPIVCALFPLEKGDDDQWFVRQKGYRGEKWDLFCLDPKKSKLPAKKSLQTEVALAAEYESD